jgi:hypothetical protein
MLREDSLAYGGGKASDTLVQTGTNGFFGAGTASLVDSRAGWVAGAGTEWMFAPRWSGSGGCGQLSRTRSESNLIPRKARE